MKRLIKLAVLIIVLLVLTFSSNPTIEKTRTLALRYGEVLYEKGVNWMSKSEVDWINNTAEILEKDESL